MKKLLLFFLLPVLLCTGKLAAQTVSPATQGVNCGGTATITVNVGGALYYATTTGGLVIQDGGADKALVVTTNGTLTVRAASGGGQVVISLASNPNVEVARATVTINALQLGQISGTNLTNGLSCIASNGSGTYSIPAISGATYVWRITAGGQHTRIISSSGNTVTVESLNEGNSALTAYVFNDCTGDLCAADSRTIKIKKTFSLAANEVLGGPACMDASVLGEDNILVYSVKPYLGLYDTHADYQWTLTAGLQELYRSADGSTISLRVNDPSVDQQVSIVIGAACNGSSNSLTKVLKAPAPAPTFASESFCVSDVVGSQATFAVTNNPEGKYSYQWVLPANWTIVSQNGPDRTQVTVQFDNSSTGNITVAASNAGCGTKFASFNVNRYPAVAPTISGATCVKFGDVQPITYSVQGGNNTYTWDVQPAGTGWIVTTGNGPAIDIIPAYGNIPANGKVTVRATIQGNCGTAPVTSSLDVEIGPAQPGVISGLTCVPNGTGSVTYSVAEVARNKGYQWTIPGTWSVTGGTSGSSVTVNPNNTDGTIKVLALGCSSTTNSAETTLAVQMGPAMPGTISGPNCVKFGTTGMQYSIAQVAKATSYQWEVPAGWTKTVAPDGLSMTVTATNNNSGDVRVRAIGCESSTSEYRTLAVSIGPPQPAAIAGVTCINAAGNQIYSINPLPTDPNITYSWAAPGWTIVSGAGTPSITVTPGTGNTTISVTALGCNVAANSDARTLAVSVAPAQPGPVTYYIGDDTNNTCLGNGANQVVHLSVPAVSGATSYTWTVNPWNSGSSNTTTPTLAAVTDATSDATVSVIANGAVAGCNSVARTLELNRSGLQFCINVDPLSSTYKYYTVDPAEILNGTAEYYAWFIGDVPIIDGPEENACPARNTAGTVKVQITDGTGCVTTLSITTNHPVGYQECNYTPLTGGRMASSSSAAAPNSPADDETAGLSEDTNKLQLFPNPVKDELKIKMPSEAKQGSLAIYSIQGKEMGSMSKIDRKMNVNVSNYPDGNYFVIISTPTASFYGKFVVKH